MTVHHSNPSEPTGNFSVGNLGDECKDDSRDSHRSHASVESRKSRSRSTRARSGRETDEHSLDGETLGGTSHKSSPSNKNDNSPTTRREQSPDSPASRYESLEEVGRGGWGIVDRALDRQLDREVAVKRFCDAEEVSEQERQRFLHEAKVTSQLQHPGIVPVHELGDRQNAFYVMKLLDGMTLSDFLKQHHRNHSHGKQTSFQFGDSLEPLLQRFVDVCHAVAYAHQRGVVHRDLKPSNVMISDFGETVVLDWGLAQSSKQDGSQSPDSNRSSKTRNQPSGHADVSTLIEPDGTIVGTPAYMSPEQARGEISRISSSSDLYSLGVILYTLVAGRSPYHGQRVERILEQVARGDAPDLRTVQPLTPAPLLSIVRKAMSASPFDRYTDAASLAGDVRRFIAGDSVSVHQENLWERGVRWCRHHQAITATATASILLLMLSSLAFGFVIHRSHQAEKMARMEAERAHQETIQQLGEVLETTDTWLVELSGSLQFYPGLEPIRNELIQQSIQQYSTIASDFQQNLVESQNLHASSISPEFNRSDLLAILGEVRARLRLGDLHRLTGDHQKAQQQYAAAEKRLSTIGERSTLVVRNTSLTADAKTDPLTQLQLERINALIGRLLLASSDTSIAPTWQEIQTARRWLNSPSKAFREDSVHTQDSIPSPFHCKVVSAKVRLELALERLASMSVETSSDGTDRKWDPTDFENAVRSARTLVSLRGTAADHRLSETIQQRQAERLQLAQQHGPAIDAWSELITDLQRLCLQSPDRVDTLQSLAHALLQRGNLRVASHQPTAAADDYNDAIESLEHAWRMTDSDGFYRINLATAENNLGQLLSHGESQQPERAKQLLNRSLQTYESLLRENMTTQTMRRYAQTKFALASLEIDHSSTLSDSTRKHAENAVTAFDVLHDHDSLSNDELLDTLQLLEHLIHDASSPDKTPRIVELEKQQRSFHNEIDRRELTEEQAARLQQITHDQSDLTNDTTRTTEFETSNSFDSPTHVDSD
ncbi:serine/threonine protein kinase [Rhodopirellula sp. JC740]|uniref:Serine/threonine protein kinase n=1 Tax=Rhodopirellula halodulae TaxID=2894198 RepID=A0ABS8NP66_9BACT|nr:serine/threonine-protein kinase [Rhodopirellula sp. JC740]MCC9645347.1 serine/threonine protein kinase [Rhodopirellula sp. JC740]